MNKVLRILVALPAILFVVTGLRYVIEPAATAQGFGMTLQEGIGRSSQIGDLTGFFLSMGLCILMALITGRRTWYYPPVMALLITAAARVLAWLYHDAALATQMIAVEVIVAGLLLVAAKRLPSKE